MKAVGDFIGLASVLLGAARLHEDPDSAIPNNCLICDPKAELRTSSAFAREPAPQRPKEGVFAAHDHHTVAPRLIAGEAMSRGMLRTGWHADDARGLCDLGADHLDHVIAAEQSVRLEAGSQGGISRFG